MIEGVDKEDCIELKDIFGRGQCYNDEKAISDIDFESLKRVGFRSVKKIEILINEYYETKDDLLALLLKTPILMIFLKKVIHNLNIESGWNQIYLSNMCKNTRLKKEFYLREGYMGL